LSLHACCHNPTGVDLTAPQWREVIAAVGQQQLIPFLDMAYQGFAEGIAEDAIALNLLAQFRSELFRIELFLQIVLTLW